MGFWVAATQPRSFPALTQFAWQRGFAVSLNTEGEPNGGQFRVLAIHPLPDTCLQGLAISTWLMSVHVAGLDIRSEFMSAGFHVAVTQALLCNSLGNEWSQNHRCKWPSQCLGNQSMHCGWVWGREKVLLGVGVELIAHLWMCLSLFSHKEKHAPCLAGDT